MADRRRSTMQASADPHSNARSGIPMPASSIKPKPGPSSSGNMRMSLAGPALRPPPLSQSGPGTAPRQSVFRSQNTNPLLQSTTKSNAFGRTPLNNSTRRGSMWGGGGGGGGSAVAPPSSSQTMKDTRPLRDRPYQVKMRHDIINWLQHTGYEITMQVLVNITGKDFRAIFQHLVYLLDPCHPFDPKARFEDEFIPALKSLRYPFVNQMDVRWLAAPASMHSWPALLGVLHWLVEMSKGRESYLDSAHPTLQNSADVPEEFDDPNHHQAVAFDYYRSAYEIFLDGTDAFAEEDQKLEDRYARKDEKVILDLEAKKEMLAQAKAEYDKLLSAPAPVEKLQKANQNMKRDSEKFAEVIKRYEARKRGLIETIAYEKAELARRSSDLERLKREQENLSEVVKTQNLSPEEVERMNTDHETLSRNLADLRAKLAETHKHVMSLEVTVANRSEAAEQALDAYNNYLASLNLFPPLPDPWADVDLTLELNTASANPALLLRGADIRRVVRPTLSSIAEVKRAERADVESERIKVEDEVDRLTVECENIEQDVIELEKKVAAVNYQADDLRDATQRDALVSSREAERLERELAQARTAALANGMGVKSRLQALQIEYREQVDKVSRLRDETVRAIVKNSHEIAMFKDQVGQQLKYLKEFAETN
ncbi:hypothetical protein PLICRDRAFT_53458 [Plicaturopsis crispa FD-325 SS-3]|nr:hypothetical protein PLICRDRAFT_53458 [Plicaturopsis crispa FD-325 SS-3]